MSRAVATAIAVLGLCTSGCYHLAQLTPSRAEAGAPKVYAERCSSCHGESGRGDGLAGRSLRPPPRDFADRSWQESTTDERIARAIREGGAALGLSPLMPPQPDLSRRELRRLVAYVREVGRRHRDAAASPEGPVLARP